jgi:hypothetical protein
VVRALAATVVVRVVGSHFTVRFEKIKTPNYSIYTPR